LSFSFDSICRAPKPCVQIQTLMLLSLPLLPPLSLCSSNLWSSPVAVGCDYFCLCSWLSSWALGSHCRCWYRAFVITAASFRFPSSLHCVCQLLVPGVSFLNFSFSFSCSVCRFLASLHYVAILVYVICDVD